VTQLTFGAGLFPIQPLRQMLDLVKMADDTGYTHVWMGDSQLIWREVYVNLGAAATVTKRVTLAQGVTNPITRHITVTASALATLSELAEGRVALGIGAGDSSVETWGAKPATMAQLGEAVQTVRRLLAGETVKLANGDVHLAWAKPTRMPLFIAGSGPKILRVAGRVADGAIILTGVAPEYVRAAIESVREGAREVGRDLDAEGFKFVCWAPTSISKDGKAARDFVKSHVARVLKRPLPFTLTPEDQEVVRRIYAEYEYYEHMVVGTHHGDLVPDRMVPRFAIAGTVEECREQVEQLRDTGLHQVAIVPHSPDPNGRLEMVRTFAEKVASIT
jgi:5,10-methylenetetrahydromethanopterin reductase